MTLGEVLDEVGHRSFGPLLLLPGLIVLAPVVGDIPGVPTLMAVVVALVALQLLAARDHFWLPGWLLERSVSTERLRKAVRKIRRPARFVDRLMRPRLVVLTEGPAIPVVAATCLLIALAMPGMEFVPFSATLAGAAITAFGLALIARDGVLALIAFAVTAAGVGGALWALL